MRHHGKTGSIVNVAFSSLGKRVMPGVPSYAAAKAGLLHLA
jgi:NAD(P)-dependent dehydrogenase (short-subunit alcohol dehydrogenase family)